MIWLSYGCSHVAIVVVVDHEGDDRVFIFIHVLLQVYEMTPFKDPFHFTRYCGYKTWR